MRPWTITAKSDKATSLVLVGNVGDPWDGFTASALISEIEQISASLIDVTLSTYGGLAFDGVAIYSALTRHPARIEVTVDGVAASAGSIILMAGDQRRMLAGSQVMVHEANGVAAGTADEMEKATSTVRAVNVSMLDIYSERATGLSRDEWSAAMKTETWFSGQAAVDAGLVHEIVQASEGAPAATLSDRLDVLIAEHQANHMAAVARFGGAVKPAAPTETTEGEAPVSSLAAALSAARKKGAL